MKGLVAFPRLTRAIAADLVDRYSERGDRRSERPTACADAGRRRIDWLAKRLGLLIGNALLGISALATLVLVSERGDPGGTQEQCAPDGRGRAWAGTAFS